jgi:hypothetical protein
MDEHQPLNDSINVLLSPARHALERWPGIRWNPRPACVESANTDRDVVDPHIAFCGTRPLEQSLNSSGIRTVRLEPVLRRVRSRFTPRIIARLVRYIRKHRIDLVHTHLLNAHVWGAVATRLSRARLVEHVHDHRYTDRRALAPLGPDVPSSVGCGTTSPRRRSR